MPEFDKISQEPCRVQRLAFDPANRSWMEYGAEILDRMAGWEKQALVLGAGALAGIALTPGGAAVVTMVAGGVMGLGIPGAIEAHRSLRASDQARLGRQAPGRTR